MKKLLCMLLVCLLSASLITANGFAADGEDTLEDFEGLDLQSEAAILMDAETGQILFDKNANRTMFPASTTKILTALVAVETCEPDEVMTVSKEAVSILEPRSSNIALQEGEKLTVRDGLFAMMMPSANDAANVIAEHIAGSQEAFAELLTKRAHEIGATRTHFTNAHGLHEDSHYTTAYDMALITRYAMQNEAFREYFGTPRYTMGATNKQSEERPFTNYQYMLVKETAWYDATIDGGKVGFTNEAEHTMSTVATRGGRTLICVVFKSSFRDWKFSDTEQLLDYGFSQFAPYTLPASTFDTFTVPIGTLENVEGHATFSYSEDITLYLPFDLDPENIEITYNRSPYYETEESAHASVMFSAASDADGFPEMFLDLPLAAEIDMIAVPVSLSRVEHDPYSLGHFISKVLGSSFAVLIGVILILFALALLLLGVRQYNLQKRRRERQARLALRNRYRALQDDYRPRGRSYPQQRIR